MTIVGRQWRSEGPVSGDGGRKDRSWQATVVKKTVVSDGDVTAKVNTIAVVGSPLHPKDNILYTLNRLPLSFKIVI
ncbi:hypothetical protein IEQ34_010229 [Dendrobium chrysotoxum]|uniref:Uncharacterized protein n=1 Tax=Dendrobium chrysotoxum TaxID=161865 RepID=A0AAV7H3M4_DENCH|nr:hypothetical protein IEQ34_010229 [Dendrobium chrysotoxum]